MRNLKKLSDFELENSKLNITNMATVFGGLTQQTGDWCQTLNDTCNNNCSDIHHVKSVDGTVVYDKTTYTNNDC